MPRKRIELDERQIHQVEALGAVLSIEQMADYFGFSHATMHAILKRQESVFLAYKKGRARAVAGIAQGVIKRALSGDNACAFFYLKTQAGWRETDKSNQDQPTGQQEFKIVCDFGGVVPAQQSTKDGG